MKEKQKKLTAARDEIVALMKERLPQYEIDLDVFIEEFNKYKLFLK